MNESIFSFLFIYSFLIFFAQRWWRFLFGQAVGHNVLLVIRQSKLTSVLGLALYSRVWTHFGTNDEVVENLDPRVMARQVVIEFGSDLFQLFLNVKEEVAFENYTDSCRKLVSRGLLLAVCSQECSGNRDARCDSRHWKWLDLAGHSMSRFRSLWRTRSARQWSDRLLGEGPSRAACPARGRPTLLCQSCSR